MIDFKTLMALSDECDGGVRFVIEYLAMNDVPMTDVIIQLGIALGILLPGYRNGWSEELEGL